MKLIKKIQNRRVIIYLLVFILVFISVLMGVVFRNIIVNNKIKNKKEEITSKFSWETMLFEVNDNYTYTFTCLVTIQEINGIETIKYCQEGGKEITVNGNGKQKIGLDFKALENKDYEFKIKPVGKSEKIETLNVKRKVSGENTYKLVNGVYVNTPFLENFNSKYTRYLTAKDENTLNPSNWIYDEEPQNWYDYNNQRWANVYVEAEGVEAYYVWIPRYVYKLDQSTQRSDVKFVDVNNNYTDAKTGNVTRYKELVEQGYQLPEAFDFGDGNGENGVLMTSISGYWISKYQLSELAKFNINYNMTAGKSSIVLSNYTNNVSDKASSYTFSINGKIVNTATNLEEYTFTGLTENESYIVNLTALDANGAIVGSMTKTLEPIEVNPPDLTGFNPQTTFYVYYDVDGTEHSDISISENPPEDWYNYTYSNWANIVTRNNGTESYFVWIPRYQYKLNQTSQRSDVKFILGTSDITDAGYQIPEAFWWDKNDNGQEDDGEQLTGYWMSKYQLSN